MKPLDTKRWVPDAAPEWEKQLEQLVVAARGRRLCFLTGAGCSTESGIPDYRGEGTAQRARNPIKFQQFVADDGGRRRYWARATYGWPRFRSALPSGAHEACAEMEATGLANGVITQNVDRLHTSAGSTKVVELHGALQEVVCLSCGLLESRDDLHSRLMDLNAGFLKSAHELAPDGDADIPESLVRDFTVADCIQCGGVLKPRVVFFGEGVPRATVEAAWEMYRSSDALLVAGSSLTVFSGYRFARQAKIERKPVFVVNIGKTRADDIAQVVVRGHVGRTLRALSDALRPPSLG